VNAQIMQKPRNIDSHIDLFSASRRRVLVAFTAMVAMPRWAPAQLAKRSYRIGWLASIDSFKEPYGLAFVQRLGELGFVEGDNLSLPRRHAAGQLEKLPSLVAELVKLSCDVFFSAGPEANLVALKQASRDTPIVFVAVDFDPIATGHIVSAARPGGHVTGITAVQSVLPGKRLELLKELLPDTRRVAVFANDQTTGQLAVTQAAAPRLDLALHVIQFKRPPFDYETAFADAVRARADVLLVLGSGLFVPARRKIPELALKARLPSSFHHSQWAEAGGLMSYGFNFPHMWRSGADMVAKILRGARAGDIPMEQPTTYELAINSKTARALGIRIPESIRVRVDRVIE
jgi:putative ABC transport system substrate-binding protein